MICSLVGEVVEGCYRHPQNHRGEEEMNVSQIEKIHSVNPLGGLHILPASEVLKMGLVPRLPEPPFEVSHYLVATTEARVRKPLVGDRKIALALPVHAYPFPIDKPELVPIVERLLGELRRPE